LDDKSSTGSRRLITLVAFEKDRCGRLKQAFQAREMANEEFALRDARWMAVRYDGVVVLMREFNTASGKYGAARVLFQAGEIVPSM
jgi:hypothetical protein